MSDDQKKAGRPPKGPASLTRPVTFKTTDRGLRVIDALVRHYRTLPGNGPEFTQADLLRMLVRDRYVHAVKRENLTEIE